MHPTAHGGALPESWQALAQEFRRRASECRAYAVDERAATIWERAAADVERIGEEHDDQLVPLARAAQLSGYSVDGLRKKASRGDLPVHKRGRRSFFRIADLPKKAGAVAYAASNLYDASADARWVTARRNHGGTTHGT